MSLLHQVGRGGGAGGGGVKIKIRNVCNYANYSNWRGKDRSTEKTKSDFLPLQVTFDIFFLNGY